MPNILEDLKRAKLQQTGTIDIGSINSGTGGTGNILEDLKRAKSLRGTQAKPTKQVKEPEITEEEKKAFVRKPAMLGVATGILKGIGSTLAGSSSLGEKILQGGLRMLLPKAAEKKLGISKTTAVEEFGIREKLQPKKGEGLGFMAEQVGEFLIPGAAPYKLGGIAKKVITGGGKLAGVLQGGAKLGTVAIGEGALGLGQTALQKGGFDDEAKAAGLFGLATPPVLKGLGALARPVGKLLSEIIGKTTGAGSQAISEAFSNPNVKNFFKKSGKTTADLFTESVDDAKRGLNTIKERARVDYRTRLAELKTNKKDLSDGIDDVRTALKNELLERGIKIKGNAKTLNDIDFTKSTITNNENVTQRAINDVLGWTDTTASGLDTLKKRLGDYVNNIPLGNPPAKTLIQKLQSNVTKMIKEKIPEYEIMTSGWQKAKKLTTELEKALSIGDKAQQETAVRKLIQIVRRDDDSRRLLLQSVSEASGVDIQAKISAGLLGQATPRGLAGALTPTAGIVLGTTGLFNLLPIFALTSPKLMGELTAILGKVTKKMIETNTLSPQIQRAVRALLIKSQQ